MESTADIESKPPVHAVEDIIADEKPANTLPPPDPIDVEAERKLKWRIDLLVLPLLTGFYFFQSMVRLHVLFFTPVLSLAPIFSTIINIVFHLLNVL
jgi:hypothetical protein